MKLSCSQQQPLEIHTAALKLIDQIAHNVYIVGRDDICAVCNLFDLAFIRICNTAQKIHQTTRDILVCLLQIEAPPCACPSDDLQFQPPVQSDQA